VALTAEATNEVGAAPRAVLELVLDLDRYRQADRKIVRVISTTGPDADGRGSVRFWGRLRFMPPLPDTQLFVLERWSRLTFTGAPRQPGRLVFGFTGTFECEETAAGCRFTHRYEFRFRGPFRVVERILGTWLQDEIEAEVAKVKTLVEAS
jgi:hypothetical protein